MSQDLIFGFTKQDEEAISNDCEKSKEEIQEMVEELETWRKAQLHFPKDDEVQHLPKMLRINKFNIEKTKWKLNNYYSYKNYTPEFYENRSLSDPKLNQAINNIMIVPFPKLHKNTTRVLLAKLINPDPNVFDLETIFKIVFIIGDLRIHYDEAINDIYILDYKGASLKHILKIKPFLLKKAFHVIRNVFSDRILGIHMLNFPSYANFLIMVAKTILPKKIADRIHIHETDVTIKDHIDLETLPEEYGGKEVSIEVLYENWRRYLDSKNTWLENESLKKTIEDLRPKDTSSYVSKLKKIFNTY